MKAIRPSTEGDDNRINRIRKVHITGRKTIHTDEREARIKRLQQMYAESLRANGIICNATA
jgi:hypothetical protein